MTARRRRSPRESVSVDDVSSWRSLLEEGKCALVRWQKYGIHGFLVLVVGTSCYLAFERSNLVKQRDEAIGERDRANTALALAKFELYLLRARAGEGWRGGPQPVEVNIINVLTDGNISDVLRNVDVRKLPEFVQPGS